MNATLPPSIRTVDQLEDLLSEPTPSVIEAARRLEGDVILLGVGGKMGPTLARMLRRAFALADLPHRVIGVSRFSSESGEAGLRAHGIETLRCDLLDEAAVAALPEAPNVIYMPARKFGSAGQESLTWAMNAYLPAIVCRKFRSSRIVAFSTGNVYPLTPIESGGSRETDAPDPVGEYGMSCLGRERIFEHFSRTLGIPAALVRLNYACELRYGVLVDIARRVRAGRPIDLTMGYFNTIWQGDANAMTLQCFGQASAPPRTVNLTGPELLSVREVANRFAELFQRQVQFSGGESPTALLNNATATLERFGQPRVNANQLIGWIADWVQRDGEDLGKPTHFQTRDGKF